MAFAHTTSWGQTQAISGSESFIAFYCKVRNSLIGLGVHQHSLCTRLYSSLSFESPLSCAVRLPEPRCRRPLALGRRECTFRPEAPQVRTGHSEGSVAVQGRGCRQVLMEGRATITV